ncbi:MAG: FG-GAP repeat protein, partial [Pirellulales bacterium]
RIVHGVALRGEDLCRTTRVWGGQRRGPRIAHIGAAVVISGNTAIVGASHFGRNDFEPSSAYLFDVTTGQELFKLTGSDAAINGGTGVSVAIHGNRAIMGVPGNHAAGIYAGSAYLFDVPEPSSVVLGAIGLVGVLAYLVGPGRYTLSAGAARNAREGG